MDIKEILKYCDHTLLRVDCTEAEIRKLCDQAIKYECASVCIPPAHVPGAKRYVGDRMKICTVIGFPNGYMSTAAKAFETADAVANGADEIDMVINLSMVKDGCWEDVAEDIKAVRRSCMGKILKVIIECCLLTDEEKMRLCTIVAECGADFIKTSTGFSTGGATTLSSCAAAAPRPFRSRQPAVSPIFRTLRISSLSARPASARAASSSSQCSLKTRAAPKTTARPTDRQVL